MILSQFCDEYAALGLRPTRLLMGLSEKAGPGGVRVVPFCKAQGSSQGPLWEAFLKGGEWRGECVVYWMTHARRLQHNAALAVAMLLSKKSGKPLLVVESLTSNYPWASERHHAFVADGVAERLGLVEGIAPAPGYLFVGVGGLEQEARTVVPEGFEAALVADVSFPPGQRPANAGVLPAVFRHASCVVSDWAPWFLFPGLVARTQASLTKQGVPFLLVDDCGLVPLAEYKKAEAAARFLRPKLAPYIAEASKETEATERVSAEFSFWMRTLSRERIENEAKSLAKVHSAFVRGSGFENECASGSKIECASAPRGVDTSQGQHPRDAFVQSLCAFARVQRKPGRVPLRGGEHTALCAFERFAAQGLARYDEDRNHPDLNGTSRMSPYLHYGMVHPRTLIARVEKEAQSTVTLFPVELSASKYVDELVTWRELGLNMAHFAFEAGIPLGSLSLVPAWALKTLREHMGKKEPPLPLSVLESAQTPDPVWNAAQRELVATGQLHNYMRMLWGKGIVAWSASPEEALQRMVHLNNAYALDGRDPNSYTGIYWCLGKFDRPWPPARPPFGITRSMSTKNARKKLSMERYLERFAKM